MLVKVQRASSSESPITGKCRQVRVRLGAAEQDLAENAATTLTGSERPALADRLNPNLKGVEQRQLLGAAGD